jgi:hypothetical protein
MKARKYKAIKRLESTFVKTHDKLSDESEAQFGLSLTWVAIMGAEKNNTYHRDLSRRVRSMRRQFKLADYERQ